MHGPCLKCGSSDARFSYDDGHGFCFACESYDGTRPDAAVTDEAAPTAGSVRFLDVDVRAITKRGINTETAEKWGYGFSEYRGKRVHVATYRDQKGRRCGQKVRFPDKEFEIVGDLKPAGLFGQWLWRDSGRMVVVTEGEIDALTVSQLQGNKWPVVSVPNGAQSAKKAILHSMEWLEKFDRVVFLFDNDEPGIAAAAECAMVLTPGKAYVATLPLKDANEMLQANRGKEVIDAVWGAKMYRPDGLVQGDAVWDIIVKEDNSKSHSIPHSGLQSMMRGFRDGEIMCLVAGTGTGKSTWCREMAHYDIATNKQKVGYIALEENVRTAALGLMSISVNRPLRFDKPEEIRTPAIRAVFEELKNSVVFYDHFGSLESDNLLGKIRYMIKADGCGLIVLDHLSIVVSDLDQQHDERKTIDSIMTKLASLAQETGARILVVSHLSRPKGVPHEEGRAITLSDLRGSGSIGQLSHNVVALERNQQSTDPETKDTDIVRLLKCRWTGSTGIAGYLRYNTETGRLMEWTSEFKEPVIEPDDGREFGQ